MRTSHGKPANYVNLSRIGDVEALAAHPYRLASASS